MTKPSKTLAPSATTDPEAAAKALFGNATSWLRSAIVLKHAIASSNDGFAFVPMFTCAAFSLELHFKCLIRLSGGIPGDKHDLKKLFDAIEPSMQSEIRRRAIPHLARFERQAKKTPGGAAMQFDFDSVLSDSKDAFQTLRYIHEGIMEIGKGWSANSILDATHEYVLSLRPHWRRKA